MSITIKRVYEPVAKQDGFRILVDRLWPRGLGKEEAHMDLWLKEVGPSTGLRKWFDHDPAKWAEFHKRYRLELKDAPALSDLIGLARKHRRVTLLFGAKDERFNQAAVLKEMIVEAL
jgi:uncharacterized protein YeaO (DUF488 family)